MERYTVAVSPPGAQEFQLLIPLRGTLPVSELASEVKRRVLRLGVWPNISDIALHLGSSTGPVLDPLDVLRDVIPNPKTEAVTATSGIKNSNATGPGATQEPELSKSSRFSNDSELSLRIITPALARAFPETRYIPVFVANITRKTKLRDINTYVHNFLKIPVMDSMQEDEECNCSFARQISDRGIVNETLSEGSAIPHTSKVVVVHGRNQVELVEINATTSVAILDAVATRIASDNTSKTTSIIGGTLSEPGDKYLTLPTVSICAQKRHKQRGSSSSDSKSELPQSFSTVDIHTSEAPIELSESNVNMTLEQLKLTDCTVNGVLDLYVVERKYRLANTNVDLGKDAIFLQGDSWAHPSTQSKRGIAMLLSSLRCFSGLINAKNMEAPSQDAVLHIFYRLTRFLPAVRALHILMSGKSPRPCERAALSQAIFEVLKDIVPKQLVRSVPGRVFEGTRLLLGLILEKAKHLKHAEEKTLPYMDSMRVLDLRNTFTMDPIFNAIQTNFGIVEKGYFEALKAEGIIHWKAGGDPLSSLPIEAQTKRVAYLCSGIVPEITIFDMDRFNSFSGYSNNSNADIFTPRELSDLNHLSVLCSRNNFSVLAPSALPSAQAPALTLDREGHLAVYVGRAACAMPGRDIAIFRPADGGEEHVDVSIITQLLVPILARRQVDGTAAFEAFGDCTQRKYVTPDEIIMLCVDCSKSMEDDNDFSETIEEMVENDPDREDSDDERVTASVEDSSFQVARLDDMKALVSEHESLDDMLSIIHDTQSSKRKDVASRILEILSGMYSTELSHNLKKLEKLKLTAPNYLYQRQLEGQESRNTKLKSFIAGFTTHSAAIIDFLVYRAMNFAVLDTPWTWGVGDDIPEIPVTASTTSFAGDMPSLTIPENFMCPISKDLMDDPVKTCDGFSFERNNIERWFQIRDSSPLTGLVLENTDLHANGALQNEIKQWTLGTEITHLAQDVASATSSESRAQRFSRRGDSLTVKFFSRSGSFTRRISKSLTTLDLYQLAFRGIKGQHAMIRLHADNVFIPPSQSAVSTTNLHTDSLIHIQVKGETGPSSQMNSTANQATSTHEDLCLIKVFESYQTLLFSYWVPQSTAKSLASVVFRYWRYKFKSCSRTHPRNVVLWTDMKNAGDGHSVGNVQNYWDRLSDFLNRRYAKARLTDETMFDADDHDSDDSDDSDTEMEDGAETQPLVFKIQMGWKPRREKSNTSRNLSRLDVLKTMFDAFVNRLLAYNFRTHLGLITFRSTPDVSQSITHAVESFRHKLNNMVATGDTALWDALALATDQLADYQRKYPKAKMRIICISDGADTKSTKSAGEVSWGLQRASVVVDSICLGLGMVSHVDLQTVSYLTGGYTFDPNSLEEAMAICEMEPVLNQMERPAITLPKEAYAHPYDKNLYVWRFVFSRHKAVSQNPEIVTRDVFPQRKKHPNLADTFVQLASLTTNATNSSSVTAHTDSNLRSSRIMSEMRQIVANPHPYYDIYVSESNMSFWKVVMQGPPDSAYSSGTFILYLDMEDDYPSFAPKCRFITPIYHPNINRHGKVCHSILDRNWTSDTSNSQVISTIYSLLMVPEFSDPINAVVTLDFHWDEVQFRNEAKAHIEKYAKRTREDWKEEILNPTGEDSLYD
ncbi:hypothetical protein BGZ60DRAFT_544304 [Tricladium varicosporioides]|nr:hypothetical protein BGZ60DRAFT_544304 [Hymenoscyphus varicosporioides]